MTRDRLAPTHAPQRPARLTRSARPTRWAWPVWALVCALLAGTWPAAAHAGDDVTPRLAAAHTAPAASGVSLAARPPVTVEPPRPHARATHAAPPRSARLDTVVPTALALSVPLPALACPPDDTRTARRSIVRASIPGRAPPAPRLA